MKISSKRHLAKTISYRILSSSIGFIIISVTTHDYKIGAAFSASELLFKPFIYYIHERCWFKYIKYGITKD